MKEGRAWTEGGALVSGLLILLAISGFFPSAVVKDTREVRWLIAHEPTDLFSRAADIFATELAKESDGELTLRVVGLDAMGYSGNVPVADIFRFMEKGEIELSSILAVGLEQQDSSFGIVNLPFLFKDYESAERILDGDSGKALLASVSEHTPIQALSFTFSGGFRILASEKKIGIKGQRVAINGGAVSKEIFRLLGATPIMAEEEYPADTVTVETVYTRIAALGDNTSIEEILETKHSLFLTAIVASDSFYESLTTKQRFALEKAASAAAKAEREDSIALAAKTREELLRRGVHIVTLSPAETETLKQRLQPVYGTFANRFDQSVVQAILSH